MKKTIKDLRINDIVYKILREGGSTVTDCTITSLSRKELYIDNKHKYEIKKGEELCWTFNIYAYGDYVIFLDKKDALIHSRKNLDSRLENLFKQQDSIKDKIIDAVKYIRENERLIQKEIENGSNKTDV